MSAQIWPLCRAAGVSLAWLPARSPWFNPIEKFNGWLKQAVASDVGLSGAPGRGDMKGLIEFALNKRSSGMTERCRGWIDFLFA